MTDETPGTETTFSDREFATILAALRRWQREGWRSCDHEHQIASNNDEFLPMTAEEIDELCERINCGERS